MSSLAALASTIRGRIFIAFLAMSLLTGGLGFYAVVAIDHIGELVSRTYDQSLMSINYARATAADFAKMRAAFARHVVTKDPAVAAQLDAHITELLTTLAEDLTIAVERAQSDRAVRAASAVQSGVAAWDEMRRNFSDAGAMRAERWDALDHQANQVDAQLDLLLNYTGGDGFTFRQAARNTVSRELQFNIGVTALAIVGAALIAWFLHRRIRGPLAAASGAAERIAGGHLDDMIPTSGRDELGSLLRAMAVMRDNIRAMMDGRSVNGNRPSGCWPMPCKARARVLSSSTPRVRSPSPTRGRWNCSRGSAPRTTGRPRPLPRSPLLQWRVRAGRRALASCQPERHRRRWPRGGMQRHQRAQGAGGAASADQPAPGRRPRQHVPGLVPVRRPRSPDGGEPALCRDLRPAPGAVVPGMSAPEVFRVSLGQGRTSPIASREPYFGQAGVPAVQELATGKVIAVERRDTADGGSWPPSRM